MKEYIKTLVKEGLGGLIKEKETKKKKKTKKDEENDKDGAVAKSRSDQDQQSIQNASESPLAPPESHVMAAADTGNPKSASDRADFNHQLNQTHGRGFEENNLAKVSAIYNSLNLMGSKT